MGSPCVGSNPTGVVLLAEKQIGASRPKESGRGSARERLSTHAHGEPQNTVAPRDIPGSFTVEVFDFVHYNTCSIVIVFGALMLICCRQEIARCVQAR